jgi:hypothetical protein
VVFAGAEKVFAMAEKVFAGADWVFAVAEKVFAGANLVFARVEKVLAREAKVFAAGDGLTADTSAIHHSMLTIHQMVVQSPHEAEVEGAGWVPGLISPCSPP